MKRKIWESGAFRIMECVDSDVDFDNLKGDLYNPKLIKEMGYTGTVEELRAEELEFEELINNEGVYGYELERWEPAVDSGWEHVDSCWGFVGAYSESDERFHHYIVDEMIGTAKAMEALAIRSEGAES